VSMFTTRDENTFICIQNPGTTEIISAEFVKRPRKYYGTVSPTS
jgi:hypothetical protein